MESKVKKGQSPALVNYKGNDEGDLVDFRWKGRPLRNDNIPIIGADFDGEIAPMTWGSGQLRAFPKIIAIVDDDVIDFDVITEALADRLTRSNIVCGKINDFLNTGGGLVSRPTFSDVETVLIVSGTELAQEDNFVSVTYTTTFVTRVGELEVPTGYEGYEILIIHLINSGNSRGVFGVNSRVPNDYPTSQTARTRTQMPYVVAAASGPDDLFGDKTVSDIKIEEFTQESDAHKAMIANFKPLFDRFVLKTIFLKPKLGDDAISYTEQQYAKCQEIADAVCEGVQVFESEELVNAEPDDGFTYTGITSQVISWITEFCGDSLKE